jgi:hypothetical protein
MSVVAMKFSSLREANAALAERSKLLMQIFAEAKVVYPDGQESLDLSRVRAITGDTAYKAAEIKRLNDELAEIGQQRDSLRALEASRQLAETEYRAQHEPVLPLEHPASNGDRSPVRDARTLGQLFTQSPQYQQYKGMRNWPAVATYPTLDIRAAVFRTGAGWSPPQIRLDRVELTPVRPIRVIDVVPMLPTGSDVIRYMEETTFTQAAAETAESTATTAADLIPEAALQLTERTRNVEWLPVFLPVTMQQMEDVEGIEEYVTARLTYAIRARLDLQIIAGNGTAPNLLGTNNVTGIQTTAKGTLPTPDAVYQTFRKIRADGFAEPSVIFVHPNDWEDVRLLRTADGIYIWGSPSEAGPERIWGVQVVQTTAATENTMTTGDYANYAAVYVKRGIDIAVSDSHAFYFTRGMLAIRADMRVSVVHFRPKAFGTVTGV